MSTKRDWWHGLTLNQLAGRRMELTQATTWRDITVPAGARCTLSGTQTRWERLYVTFDPCMHCGTKWRAALPAKWMRPLED